MANWTSDPVENLTQSFIDGRWVDELFSMPQLFPYIDQSKRTRDKLNEQSLVKKMFDKMLPKANLGALIDAIGHSITGLHLVKDKGKTSLVDECYQVLEAHQKAKQTLVDTVAKILRAQEKEALHFNGVHQQHSPVRSSLPDVDFLPTLQTRLDSIDRKFIAIDGMLCSVEAMKRVDGVQLANALQGSDCRWVISDFPPFAMGHPDFQDGIVMLEMEHKVVDELEADLPFANDIGWYPYVRVYGYCRRIFSNRFQHPALEFSWMEYRLPMNPAQRVDKVKKAYEEPSDISMLRNSGFWVDRARMAELILFVDVLRIMSRAVNLQPSQLRPELRDAMGDALERLAAGSMQARALLPDPLP